MNKLKKIYDKKNYFSRKRFLTFNSKLNMNKRILFNFIYVL